MFRLNNGGSNNLISCAVRKQRVQSRMWDYGMAHHGNIRSHGEYKTESEIAACLRSETFFSVPYFKHDRELIMILFQMNHKLVIFWNIILKYFCKHFCKLLCTISSATSLPASGVLLPGVMERNVVMWMDHRALEQASRITATAHRVLNAVGGVMSPEMQPPKLLWLKEVSSGI